MTAAAPKALPQLGHLEMTVRASDGLLLKGTLTYPAQRAEYYPLAVLAHQYPATRDAYAPLVADLLAMGMATLAFDQRGHGASIQGPTGPVVIDTPASFAADAFATAFVGSAEKVGFHRIADDIVRVAAWGAAQNFIDRRLLVLVGASVGGSGVLLAAPQIPGLAAIATLGAAGAMVFGQDGPQQVRRALEQLPVPALLASSENDAFMGAQNVRDWSEGLRHVAGRIVPGSAHAMAIYFEVRSELLSFIGRALGLPR